MLRSSESVDEDAGLWLENDVLHMSVVSLISSSSLSTRSERESTDIWTLCISVGGDRTLHVRKQRVDIAGVSGVMVSA